MPDVWAQLPPITAGALSTAVTMYPVDLVRALTMSAAGDGRAGVGVGTLLREFHAAHGAKGFVTQGVGPEMLRATYMRVLKFFLFPITHRALYGKNPSEGTVLTKASAAALCSLPEGMSIAPIETAKIGLQLDKTNVYKNNMGKFISSTIAERGWVGLFNGYFGIAYRQTSWTAAYFASLSSFKGLASNVIPDEYVKTQNLAGGMAAGMFGAVFNTPGDVIRSTIQKRFLATAPVKTEFSPALLTGAVKEFVATGAEIAAAKGIQGLWTGFPFKAMHLGGSGALLATLIPIFKTMMGVDDE
eukprot:gene21080-21034_t